MNADKKMKLNNHVNPVNPVKKKKIFNRRARGERRQKNEIK